MAQIYTSNNSSFPNQVVPDAEKATEEYGLAVGRAIEGEWFRNYRGGAGMSGYATNYNNYHTLKLYARGEQPVQKYKDELAIDGDLSYLNLDWKPVPVLAKFVDIVVNGIADRSYEINAYAQDPVCSRQRTAYARGLMTDIVAKDFLKEAKNVLNVDGFNSANPDAAPQDKEELAVHLQMDFKQSVEVAEEEVINTILDKNKYDLTRQRVCYDLTVLGIGALKTRWDRARGVVVEYVDPATLVYSYTNDPNFEDLYYAGEVKSVSLQDLKTQFPGLTDEEMETIQKYPGNAEYLRNWSGRSDDLTVQVLYFEYKTYSDQVFKIKKNAYGLEKALEKPDTFNPEPNDNFERVSRTIETLYSGAKILGHPMMLQWQLAENMTRPTADTNRVHLNYAICAPRMYKGRIESLVSRTTGFADMIQLTHLKIQQVLARVVPDGVFLDVDGLAEVDLGNGTNYNPREALNMYFQTGSIVGRSSTVDGDPNRGKVPIQELQSGSGGAKIQSLIQTYQYYLQMIRDVTGLNEARDGSMPDKQSLVGLQKLAAANSNVATRHILQAQLFLTLRACENVSLRVADSLKFPLTRNALENSISQYNVGTLDELVNLNIHDFGIFLNLEPDEEQKAKLEENIQVALKSGQIDLEDAIDVREVRNIQLANRFLKYRRKKKAEAAQQAAQANIQAQAQANQQTAEKAALVEMQKQQALAETQVQIEQAKSQFEIQRLQTEAQLKQQLLEVSFGHNVKLEQLRIDRDKIREKEIEDRKDKRTRISGTQQSQMIDQRKNNLLPSDFESKPRDNINSMEVDPLL
jgi:hypothetical protein|tara:strand:- start:53 stop:2467 length:2415 start_codon:yes stop_codon:yes gene_type:complete